MPPRPGFLLVSALLHTALFGAVFAFSHNSGSPSDPLYQVSLVDAPHTLGPADPVGPVDPPDPVDPVVPVGPAGPAGATAPPLPAPVPVPDPEDPAPEPARPEAPKPGPPAPRRTPPAPPAPNPEQTAPLEGAPVEHAPLPAPPPAQPSTPPHAVAPGNGARPGGDGGAASPPQPSLQTGGLLAYDANAVDTPPAITRWVTPEYPPRAQRLRIQGQVVVRLVVDAGGRPRDCRIEKADPVGYFEEAALDAARKTRFTPGQVNSRAVNTVVLMPFVFTLR